VATKSPDVRTVGNALADLDDPWLADQPWRFEEENWGPEEVCGMDVCRGKVWIMLSGGRPEEDGRLRLCPRRELGAESACRPTAASTAGCS
jgi:hypothetical protein